MIKYVKTKMSQLSNLLEQFLLNDLEKFNSAHAYCNLFEIIGMTRTERIYLKSNQQNCKNAEILKTFLQNHPDISDDEFNDIKSKVIQKIGGLGSCVSNWPQLFAELYKEYNKLYNVPRGNPFTPPMRRLHCCVGSGSTSIPIYVDTPSDEILRGFQKKFPDVSFSIELVKQ